jgi:hypothetical protein
VTPLLQFLVDLVARGNRGICSELVLSHVRSYQKDLKSRGMLSEGIIVALKQSHAPSYSASLASEEKGVTDDFMVGRCRFTL